MWVFVSLLRAVVSACRVLKLTELGAGKERWMGNGKATANWTHEDVSHASVLSEAGAYNKALHSHLVQLLEKLKEEFWQQLEEFGTDCYHNDRSPSGSATTNVSCNSSQTHTHLSRINTDAATMPSFN